MQQISFHIVSEDSELCFARDDTEILYTFFSKLKTTRRALFILTFMSSSVPPFTLAVLRRCTMVEVSSRCLSLILIGLLNVQLIFMILVLSTLGFGRIFHHRCGFVLHLLVVAIDRRAMSPAKLRWSGSTIVQSNRQQEQE